MNDEEATELKEAAKAFVGAAFDVLTEQHVLPTPVFHPFVQVGRDFFGPDVLALSEYSELEGLLTARFPERFTDPELSDREYPTTYALRLLEAAIARSGRDGVYASDSVAVANSIDELLHVLGSDEHEAVACRFVSHLTTVSGEELEAGDILVIPDAPEYGHLLRRIAGLIPGTWAALSRAEPTIYDPPHALVVARGTMNRAEGGYGVIHSLSKDIDDFLLLVRLLTAGTIESHYEVAGFNTLIAPWTPLVSHSGKGYLDELLRRTARLSDEHVSALEQLRTMMAGLEVPREGMATTSFDVAVGKFQASYGPGTEYEHLVDLATAFEAVLLGGDEDTEAVTFRLRSRAAALLATSSDPAEAVYRDIGRLYGLRSKLIHGGQIKRNELRKTVDKITTVPDETPFGLAIALAVDRMRDLVRRAILARVCLAIEPDPLWKFVGDTAVDVVLSDDTNRAAWRDRWHERLEAMGSGLAGDQPQAAVWKASQEDR